MQGAGVPLLLLGGGGYSTPDTGSDCDWEDLFDGLPCCDGRTLVYVSVYISFLPALRRMFPPRLLLLLVLLFVLFYFILCVCVCVCVCVRVCVCLLFQHARGPPQPLPQSRCRVREYTRTRYSPRMVSLSDCSVSIACAQIFPSLRDNWLTGWRSLRRDSIRVM